jgi:hypothetical protein
VHRKHHDGAEQDEEGVAALFDLFHGWLQGSGVGWRTRETGLQRANIAQKMHRVGAEAGNDAPKEARKGPRWGDPLIHAWNHFGA